ncbi:MAG: 2-oxoglutarate dehydrogenase E1 component [Myxococcota bacterium]|nr:2-oxoglutarate dehydrogenase E1 component [Myxococcota bacterium]MDW8361830.1 2-oxoglutarate dehydrogenase E1 component [Myxococcales bacterium]
MLRDFGVNQALVEEYYLRWCASPASVPAPWQRFFESLPPEEHPRLTSAGSIAAPVSDGRGRGNGDGVPSPPARGADGGRLVARADQGPVVLPVEDVGPPVATRTSFPPTSATALATELQGRVSALVNAYRVRGHLFADLDPLGLAQKPEDELALENFGLAEVEPDTPFATGDLFGPPQMTLGEIVALLRETYCRTIGVEYTFIEDPEPRLWLQQRMESSRNRPCLDPELQRRLVRRTMEAAVLEQFLHVKFKGAKRFSIEGGETFLPLLDIMIDRCADLGAEEIVIGMAHRGRLNVLVNVLGKSPKDLLAGFLDAHAEAYMGRGDVKYHLGYSSDRVTAAGNRVHLTLTFNPSHLEFVYPVIEGRVRAKQERRGDTEGVRVVPLVVHGDAAFIGQGVVAETLNLAYLDGYRTGGTIHVVINNQVGFTTSPRDARSTRYCTDVTRMLRCPVFHVNGEDPEAVAHVALLAAEFRQRFRRDVVVDLWCYRRYGHNEADEPRFTQPVMYAVIDEKLRSARSVPEIVLERIAALGTVDRVEAERMRVEYEQRLEAALRETREGYQPHDQAFAGLWSAFVGGPEARVGDVPTAVDRERLRYLIDRATRVPEGFTVHPTVQRGTLGPRRAAADGAPFDWATAEMLAFATLLDEGVTIRLTGQDVRRGTFSQRHAVLYDARTGAAYVPLAHLREGQGRFEVLDSPLSELGVLGFEYGYSLDSPDRLVLWEAQFGDFANGAQVIIDQFIASSEDKWNRLSGIVLLLPHGYEGQGPEHSSARLERFLSLASEDNIQVCNPTTPAQYFHLLRRQVLRPWRKPLVVMTPKSLLRHPMARSTLDELTEGRFHRILGDPSVPPDRARRVILCSGKVYYDLLQARTERGIDDIALVRIEQLYPVRRDELRAALAPYPRSAEVVWCQEEPWNMGAWFFVHARLRGMLDGRLSSRCIARPESASPATGSKASHDLEQQQLVDEALG